MVSKRPTTKQAKEQTKGMRPARARPAPTPIMFASAMPRLTARSGNFLAKCTVIVDLLRSASSATIRSSRAPSSKRASPKAARVALAGKGILLAFVERAQLVHDRVGGGVGGQVIVPGRLADPEDLADGGDGLGWLGGFAVPLRVV